MQHCGLPFNPISYLVGPNCDLLRVTGKVKSKSKRVAIALFFKQKNISRVDPSNYQDHPAKWHPSGSAASSLMSTIKYVLLLSAAPTRHMRGHMMNFENLRNLDIVIWIVTSECWLCSAAGLCCRTHKPSSCLCPLFKVYSSCTYLPPCRDTMQLCLFQILVHIPGLSWWPGSYEQGFLKHNGLDTECWICFLMNQFRLLLHHWCWM